VSYYPPPPQQNIWQAQPQPRPVTMSGLAVSGFVVSLVGLVTTPIVIGIAFNLIGIVLSSCGIHETRAGRRGGRGLAIAGLSIGIVAQLIWLMLLLVLGHRS
jgi:hypothetical protein